MDSEGMAVAKALCSVRAGLTKNQIKVVLEVVTSGKDLEGIAKDLGIQPCTLHATLNRIDKKCPGFRQRIRDLRFKGDMKIFSVSDLTGGVKLTDTDKANLNEMMLDDLD
jgi:hypothetical protein